MQFWIICSSLTSFPGRNIIKSKDICKKAGDHLGCYYHSLLTAEQQQLYQMVHKFMGCRALPCNAAVPDIHAALKALLMDHPKLCFFEGKWYCGNGMVYPQYVLPGQAAEKLEAAANEISRKFSDREYPRQVYDWMLARVAYCQNAENSQNAYGALVQRQAVCKGIAKGYQLLMEARNIGCILVEGTLDGQTKHVWNMIHYEGQWRHLDVTMGYPCFWSLTGASDACGGYLRTEEELAQSHTIFHKEILPADRQEANQNENRLF